ncbi:MAG: AMIN-like domain-containing (lipo)protein [Longimicrobiales bacterium]
MNQRKCSIIGAGFCALTLLTQACIIVEKQPESSEKSSENAELGLDDRWTAGMVAAGHAVNSVAALAAVRTAKHQDFERMVFEFSGDLPNYKVQYHDTPISACNSRETVSTAGDVWLEIRFEPAAAHDQYGQVTAGPPSLAPALNNIRGLDLSCDFESILTWVAGVASPSRFRVLELKTPTRLVVDVR